MTDIWILSFLLLSEASNKIWLLGHSTSKFLFLFLESQAFLISSNLNGSFFAAIFSPLTYHWVPSCFQSLYIFQASFPLSSLCFLIRMQIINLTSMSTSISIKPQFGFFLWTIFSYLFSFNLDFSQRLPYKKPQNIGLGSIRIYTAAPKFLWLFFLCLSFVLLLKSVLVTWNHSKLRDTGALPEWLWNLFCQRLVQNLFSQNYLDGLRVGIDFSKTFKNLWTS